MSKSYKTAVIPGDGTGPEVIREGKKVLNAVGAKLGVKFEFEEFDFGGERYKKTGEILPDNALKDLKQFDSIYLGAIGHPDVAPGILEKGILLRLRFELDQYINLRPVKLYPGVHTPIKDKTEDDIDFTVIRENTEDLYTGTGGITHKNSLNEVAVQSAVYTRKGVDRALKYAFEYAKSRRKPRPWKGLGRDEIEQGYIGQLTLVGKTNVLTYIYDLWERAFNEMGEKSYPDIKRDYNHVDACCMWMVKNPQWYDVIVTGNMFGDIITDLGAIIQGGMGIAAGGNINPEGISMFEPIGGSAPKYTGKGVINPLAAISAAQLMLDEMGEHNAADKIESAVKWVVSKKLKSLSAGKMGFSTQQVGDLVARKASE
ncbi:MAG: 3-isopropylmalate dehydrogenase [Elusimicrobiota bacterium]